MSFVEKEGSFRLSFVSFLLSFLPSSCNVDQGRKNFTTTTISHVVRTLPSCP